MKKNKKYVSVAIIRKAIANYMSSEGCRCCEDTDAHTEHKEELAKLLNVPKYPDGSGYNFYKYRSKDRQYHNEN